MSETWEWVNIIVLTPIFSTAFGAWLVGAYAQVRFFFSADRKKGWHLYFPGFRYQLDVMRGDFAPYGGPVAQGHLACMRGAAAVLMIAWLAGVVWMGAGFLVMVLWHLPGVE